MLRKLTLGLAAATALTVAALAPTTASAHGWHHRHHGWHGGFGYGLGFSPVYVGGPAYDDCLRRQRIMTHHGYRWRTVNVCY